MSLEFLRSSSFLIRAGAVTAVCGVWLLLRGTSSRTHAMAQLNPMPGRRKRELTELEKQTLEKRIMRVKRLSVLGIILAAAGTTILIAVFVTNRLRY